MLWGTGLRPSSYIICTPLFSPHYRFHPCRITHQAQWARVQRVSVPAWLGSPSTCWNEHAGGGGGEAFSDGASYSFHPQTHSPPLPR